MNTPLISVAMLTYNHEQYVAEAIDSFLNQTFQNFELVILDDASTDDTAKIIASYAQKHPDKIRFILNEKNLGIAPSWYKVLRACKGEKFLAPVCGDDIYLPNYLADHVEAHKQNPSAPFSVANGIWFESDTGRDIRPNYNPEAPAPKLDYAAIMESQCVFAPATLIKIDELETLKHLEFVNHNEWPMFAELLYRGNAAYTHTIAMRYRRHSANLSNNLDHMWPAIFEALHYMKDNISSCPEIYKSLGQYHKMYAKYLRKSQKRPFAGFYQRLLGFLSKATYKFKKAAM